MFAETDEKDISNDLLTIPYSVQESATSPEIVPQLEPVASSDSFEVEEVFPIEDETLPSDDQAEVKVEISKFEEKEIQHKSLNRRFVFFFPFSFLHDINSHG